MGKGDWYRPVDQKKYAANYEKIFGKPKKKREKMTFLGQEIEYSREFPKEDNNIYARNIRPEDYPLPKNETCVMINPKSESCQFCKLIPCLNTEHSTLTNPLFSTNIAYTLFRL